MCPCTAEQTAYTHEERTTATRRARTHPVNRNAQLITDFKRFPFNNFKHF